MLKRSKQEKQLKEKILCSLLTAGIVSVCLPGGDVWAAAADKAAEGATTTYQAEDATGTPKIIGGWDLYKNNAEALSHDGIKTNVTLAGGKYDEIIGGNHIKTPGSDIYNVTLSDTTVNMSGGEVDYIVGGSKGNNSDNTILTTGNTSVNISSGTINDMVIGGSYIKSTGNTGGGTPAQTNASTGNTNVNITGGNFKKAVFAGSAADNYTSNPGAEDEKPALTATDENTSLTIAGGTFNGQKVYGGGYAMGARSEITGGETTVVITAADTGIDCVYGGGYAGKGGKVEVGDTHVVIDVANNGDGVEDVFGGNTVYAFPGGKNSQGIAGDTLIEYKNGTSRGMIFGGSEIMGYTAANDDVSKIATGSTKVIVSGGTLNEAVLGGSKVRLTADQGNKIASVGEDTSVTVSGANTTVKGLVGGDLVQVLATNNFATRIAEGSVKNANIIVNDGTINNLYVNASDSVQIGDSNFNGAIIGGGIATGGVDDNKYAKSTVETTNVVINGGTVNGDIYGGGLSTATLRAGNQANGGISEVTSAKVTVNDGTVTGDIYAGGAAVGVGDYSGGSSSVDNAEININGGTVTGNLYAGGMATNVGNVSVGETEINVTNASINGAILGTGKADSTDASTITGNTVINLNNATVNGYISLDGEKQSLSSKDSTIAGAGTYTGTEKAAVIVKNGSEAIFDGATTSITVDDDHAGKLYGVVVNGGNAEFNADSTVIDVTNTNNGGTWNYAIDAQNNSAISFGGKDVSIKATSTGYTAQTLTVRDTKNESAEIEFKNSGNVDITSSSKYGSTAVVVKSASSGPGGSLKFDNSGDVNINAEITTQNGFANSNVIGMLLENGVTTVTNKVQDFKITATGQGVDYNGSSVSDGTAGIFVQNVNKASVAGSLIVDSKKLTVNVTASPTGTAPAGKTYKTASAIRADGGNMSIGADTDTSLDVTSSHADAYGVWVQSNGDVEILGNTNIVTDGETASYALYAENGGQITVGSEGKTVDLIGDVVSKDNGSIITLAGDTNTVQGTVKAADSGSVVLGGGTNATYAVDKFVTTNSGKISVSGGTLEIDNITDSDKFDLVYNSLEVTGKGVLKAAAENVFAEGEEVQAEVDNIILFSGGKLAISDSTYTLADSTAYSNALKKADYSAAKTTVVMLGTLTDDKTDATVEELANTGAIHSEITGTIDNNELNVGGATVSDLGNDATVVNNDLGVKDLQFEVDGEIARININSDTALTLVGGGNDDALIKGAADTGNEITIGTEGAEGSAGTLTLGNTAANSGGNLNATVALVNEESRLNVESGKFTVEGIDVNQGEVNVDNGAVLTTDTFNVGVAGGTSGTVTAAGTVNAETMNVNNGTLAVTGTLSAGTLTATSDAVITVGDSESAGTLTASNVVLNGASIMLDPVWSGNDTVGVASKAAIEFTSNVDGKLTVGQNSVLSLGTTDTTKAEAAFAATGLTWGANSVTAALYIDSEQRLNSNGGITVDGSLTNNDSTDGFATANTANFAKNSLLMLDSSIASTGAITAATGYSRSAAPAAAVVDTTGTLIVADSAKLYIANAKADEEYIIAKGFKDGGISADGWNGTNLLLNKLVKGEGAFKDGSYIVTTEKISAAEALPGVDLPNILDNMTSDTNSENAGFKYLSNAISDMNTNAQAVAAINSFAAGAENSGASHSSALAAFDVGTAVQNRLSLANADTTIRGGKGKVSDNDEAGNIWAQYIHNEYKTDAGIDGQYNGAIVGGEFAPKGKFQSGIAISYLDGDTTGSASKNNYDAWGISYYGNIRNADSNIIFDVGYSKTNNEIKGIVNSDPDTNIFTVGVKGEKLYENGNGTKFVPYAGLRYMNIDTDGYTGTIDGAAAAHYSPETANMWLLPLGITISHESVNGGWTLRPTADIAYVWTMGDNDNAMGVTVPGINASDKVGYDIMDSGFFVGRLGLEAKKDAWTYGVGYSYQKGSDSQSNKWVASIEYSF